MRKVILLLMMSASVLADVPIPSPQEQQQSWQNSVNAANTMNSQGVGNIGFNKFGDVNSGLNSLSNQVGSSSINTSKQAIDGGGQANSNIKNQYSNAGSDQNYLYNQGKAGITQCKSQSDPACNAVTRYNDDSVQASFNQYNMGTNGYANNMYVTPDPSNVTCSIIHSYAPLNSKTVQCIAGRNAQNTCSTIISISVVTHQCNPNISECSPYQSNPDCAFVSPYVEGQCNYMCDSSNHKTSNAYCPYWQDVHGGGSGGNFVWGTCKTGDTYYCSGVKQTVTCGTNAGNPSPNWNVNFSNCTQPTLATYACKMYSLNDQCSQFKK